MVNHLIRDVDHLPKAGKIAADRATRKDLETLPSGVRRFGLRGNGRGINSGVTSWQDSVPAVVLLFTGILGQGRSDCASKARPREVNDWTIPASDRAFRRRAGGAFRPNDAPCRDYSRAVKRPVVPCLNKIDTLSR